MPNEKGQKTQKPGFDLSYQKKTTTKNKKRRMYILKLSLRPVIDAMLTYTEFL